MMDVELLLKWDAIIGESPLWNVAEQRLYWLDIQRKLIHRLDPATRKNETFELPDLVTCLAFRKAGGLILTMRKQFAFFDPDSGKFEPLAGVESDQPDNRFNDGRVDPQGRFWAGTMSTKKWTSPVGHFYRFDSSLRPQQMLDKVACSNGVAWSPDGKTMYYTETGKQSIEQFDFDGDTGTIGNRRPFVYVEPSTNSFPDGISVDSEGFVWSNHVGVGLIVRYDPTGKIERQVQFPAPRATACTFGGANMTTLYVTTSRETMDALQLLAYPLSGSVFAVETGIRGIEPTAFEG